MGDSADRRRYQLFTALGALLEHVPVDVAVAVAEAGGELASLKDSGARRAVETNLKRIVELDASEPVDPKVLRRLVRRTYGSYGRYWAEGAVLPVLEPERIEPPELFEWFVAKREQMGLKIEGLDAQAGRKILSVLKDGGLVGLLCDRDIEGDGVEVTLLGERTTIPAGPATLALRTGAALIPGTIYSGPGRDHSIVLAEPVETTRTDARLREDVARVSQDLADQLSDLIRQAGFASVRSIANPMPLHGSLLLAQKA